jgi:hypothetical protein
MSGPTRNQPCPCGSGRKYKRCCMERHAARPQRSPAPEPGAPTERTAARSPRKDAGRRAFAARGLKLSCADQEVGHRIHNWVTRKLADELADYTLDWPPRDFKLTLALHCFIHHHRLRDGATPLERYLATTRDPQAARIATARPLLARVLAHDPGISIEMESLADGERFEVYSEDISRDVTRFDVLFGHLLAGDPPTLWGPAMIFEADEESRVLDVARGKASGDGAPSGDLDELLAGAVCDIYRMTPRRAPDELIACACDGTPAVVARARWKITDMIQRELLVALLHAPPELLSRGEADDEVLEFDFTKPRAEMFARRPAEMPAGAALIETASLVAPERLIYGTFTLTTDTLSFESLRAQALGEAERLTASFDLELLERAVDELEHEPQRAPARSARPLRQHPALSAQQIAEIARSFTVGWLEEPFERLEGLTSRQASKRPELTAALASLLRVTENDAERNRDQAEPKLFDFEFAVSELGLADELGQARRGSRKPTLALQDQHCSRSQSDWPNMNGDSPGDV